MSEEPGISVSAALTSPPVQLSATATRRPAARLASTTSRALFDQLVREGGSRSPIQSPIRMLATACAAMPSRRPVKPRPSVVVAFTLT